VDSLFAPLRLRSTLAALALALSLAAPPASALPARTEAEGLPEERAALPGLPPLGLWMRARDGSIADWLGQPHQGKKLLEPINVVIVDPIAASPEEATVRLLAACKKAGFPEREGHSSGYFGLIGAELYPQVPLGSEDCFSDAPFTIGNNHGRIFGAALWEGGYYFIGAFSRERVDMVTKVKHQFVSFDHARDVFTQRMDARSGYKVVGFVDLGNALLDKPELTTADHDGMAVLLEAVE
jgi:hypothetical protein